MVMLLRKNRNQTGLKVGLIEYFEDFILRKYFHFLLVLLLIIGIASCALPLPQSQPQPRNQPDVITQESPPDLTEGVDIISQDQAHQGMQAGSVPDESTLNPAVKNLLQAAYEQQRAGDLVKAAANLERAQRIEPRNPLVYRQLAWVRFAQGNVVLAEEIAKRAISLSANPQLLQEMRYLIEQCQLRQSIR